MSLKDQNTNAKFTALVNELARVESWIAAKPEGWAARSEINETLMSNAIKTIEKLTAKINN
jgi:hypothetical protein